MINVDTSSSLDLFTDYVRDYHNVAINAVAWTSLLIYETIITLDQEVELVWRSSLSLVNLIHIVVRYFSLTYLALNAYVELNTHLSIKFCELYFPFLIWGVALVVPMADILVLIRLYALYDRNRKVGLVLVILWLVELGCILGLIQTSLANTKHSPNPLPGIFSSCFPDTSKTFLVVDGGIIALVVQIIYLSMALYVMFRKTNSRMMHKLPPLTIFFRDCTMYCFVFVVMYIVNILFANLKAMSPLQFLGAGWLVAIVAISTGRMVLNLKGSIKSKDHDEVWSNHSDDAQERTADTVTNGQFSTMIYTDMMMRSPV